MELSYKALVSEEETRVYLDVAKEQYDELHEVIVQLINSVSQAVEQRTGRKWRMYKTLVETVWTNTNYTEYHSGNSQRAIWLQQKPVKAISTTVYFWDGDSWCDVATDSSYLYILVQDLDTGRTWFEEGQTFPKGDHNIKVTYQAGYDAVGDVPDGIKLAALELIGLYLKKSRQDLFGMRSRMADGLTTSFDFAWPDDVKATLGMGKTCV